MKFRKRKRIIPILLIRGDLVYKSFKFSNYKYIGEIFNVIRLFNELYVDEICIIDLDSSKSLNPINYSILREISSEAFVPLCYGGGIKDCMQAEKIFECGYEKLLINSLLFNNPSMISEIADIAGNQSIVLGINVQRNMLGSYKVYNHLNKKNLNHSLDKYFSYIDELCPGEVLIQDIDRDGQGSGCNINIIEKARSKFNIPIIINGGVGNWQHIEEACLAGADAIGISRYCCFATSLDAILINYPDKRVYE